MNPNSFVVWVLIAPVILLTVFMVPMIIFDMLRMFTEWLISCFRDLKKFVARYKSTKPRPNKIKITNRHYDLYKKSEEQQNVGGPTSPVMIKF